MSTRQSREELIKKGVLKEVYEKGERSRARDEEKVDGKDFMLSLIVCINKELFLFAPYGVSPLSRVDGAGAAVREEVKMENGHSSPLLGGLPEGERAEQMEGAASASGRLV